MKRNRLIVNGRVQGVGFRPFIYRLAREFDLAGSVSNTSQGVVIDVQGTAEKLQAFAAAVTQKHPPLAKIIRLESLELEPDSHLQGFVIIPSRGGKEHQVLISPDASICRDCCREVLDPDDRRFLYPFTNCTNCGPRLTITRSIPYDRPMTSMACFEMCPHCLAEYNDPADRRFHAQPNACPQCGPEVWLADSRGNKITEADQAVSSAARLILEGLIVAVKGLGGFHLACDAGAAQAVQRLRQRKARPAKSLAVMVPDLESAGRLVRLSPQGKAVMSGMEKPITILPVQEPFPLSPDLSPDTDSLGVMLPYTPLHVVLFYHLKKLLPLHKLPALVMTSGNHSSEPISLGNREALKTLGNIADYFLLHNRDILIRCDDSVLAAHGPRPVFFRRARGFTPAPVFLPRSGPAVLGAGPELKNTICLTKKDQAFVSQHIGDLKNLETYRFYQNTI
ncbi:MAG: carbamoyltransferase HypF, partial [Desulfonatronovibrionaceae bacterium]